MRLTDGDKRELRRVLRDSISEDVSYLESLEDHARTEGNAAYANRWIALTKKRVAVRRKLLAKLKNG